MSYTAKVKVRFGDIDHAGIAYYPRLYHHLHIAWEEFFEEYAGIPYHKVLDEERIGFPTVKVETDFLRPVRYGDTLEIRIDFPRIGRSSVQVLYTVARTGDPSPCFISRQTVVAIGMDSRVPVVVPDRFREVFVRCGPPPGSSGHPPGGRTS